MAKRVPRIYLFHCSTSYDQAELTQSYSRQTQEIKVVSLPCSGKLDILYLTKAFESGADGAAVMICKEGECRYLEGNLRARKRAQAVDGLLEEAGLGKGRIKVIQMNDNGVPAAMDELDVFRHQIEALVQGDADQ